MVTALIATGPSLPQSLRLSACRDLRMSRPCGSGDPRLALHGQPAPRAASSARRNPRSALAAMRTVHHDGLGTITTPVGAAAPPRCALRTAMVTALIATGPSLPQSLRLRACRGLRISGPCGSGDPRLALHGQPAPRAASSARRNPRSALAAMRTSHCDGHCTDRDGAVAPTVPALEGSRWPLVAPPTGSPAPRGPASVLSSSRMASGGACCRLTAAGWAA
jgi:hypothetical protein